MVWLALIVGVLGSGRSAYGQGHTWIGEGLTQMVEGARWRLGTFRINAAFTLAEAGYNSDVYYGYFQGEEVPDWTFAASIPVQLMVPLGKNVVLDLSDTPQYLFYLDTERERAWNNTFRGVLHVALERIYFQAAGGITDVRRRLSPELDINIRERRDVAEGVLFWQTSRATSLAVLFGRTRFDLGDVDYLGTNIADLLNRTEDLLDVIAYVQAGPRWRPFLDGQYGIYTFTGAGSALRNAKSYGLFGGIEFIPRTGEIVARTGTRGALRIGYLRLDIADPAQPDASGFSGEADITVDLTPRTSVHALFSRGFDFSVLSGAAYYLSTRYGGGLHQRLTRRTTLSYEAHFGKMTYPESAGITIGRNDYAAHTLSLSFILGRRLQASLLGSLDRRRAGDETVPRSRFFAGISLTYGTPGTGMALPLGGLAR